MRLPPGCEGLRVRRRTVLWTFRRPFMGRPVPRELMRNELLDLTALVPTTAYHCRSYAERYSRSKEAVSFACDVLSKMLFAGGSSCCTDLISGAPCAWSSTVVGPWRLLTGCKFCQLS